MKNIIFLFDLDGTLVLTDSIYVNVWNKLLKKFNIFVDLLFYKKNIQGKSDKYVLNHILLNQKINIQELSNLKDQYFIESIDKIEIIQGSVEFLNQLKKLNYQIGIVTNCNRKSAEAILKKIKIDLLLDYLVIGDECEKSKPYPDPYLNAIQYFNIQHNEVIIFEDSKSGILSANSVQPLLVIGLTTIFNKNELKNLNIEYSIDNYNNIDIDHIIHYNNENSFENIKKHIQHYFNYTLKEIEINHKKLKGGYICDVLQIKLTKNNNESIDTILKLENKKENNLSIMANKLGLYEREYYFYESISHYVPIKIPKFIGLIKDEQLNTIGLLLENLNLPDFYLNLNLNEENIDISLKIINDMSKLHLKFWNKDLNHIFPFLKKNNDPLFQPTWSEFISKNWNLFIEKWSFLLNKKQIDIGNSIKNRFQDIQNELSYEHLTLIHGDIKSPNLFYKKMNTHQYEPYFIDWQYICIGKGVQDLVFFIIESFDVNKFIYLKDLFLNYYYAKIKEEIKDYDYLTFKKDIINSASYYPFFVAVWFGTTPEEDLIDKNFPFFFIQKVFTFLEIIYD